VSMHLCTMCTKIRTLPSPNIALREHEGPNSHPLGRLSRSVPLSWLIASCNGTQMRCVQSQEHHKNYNAPCTHSTSDILRPPRSTPAPLDQHKVPTACANDDNSATIEAKSMHRSDGPTLATLAWVGSTRSPLFLRV
jgi:hypothetical protein